MELRAAIKLDEHSTLYMLRQVAKMKVAVVALIAQVIGVVWQSCMARGLANGCSHVHTMNNFLTPNPPLQVKLCPSPKSRRSRTHWQR